MAIEIMMQYIFFFEKRRFEHEFLRWKYEQKSLEEVKRHLEMKLASVFFMAKWFFSSIDLLSSQQFLCQLNSCCFTVNYHKGNWNCYSVELCEVLGLNFLFITNWVYFWENKYLISRRVELCVPWVDGCMYFRPTRLKLLWTTNPVAACNDTSVCECKFQHR